jgi:hypothetical protein
MGLLLEKLMQYMFDERVAIMVENGASIEDAVAEGIKDILNKVFSYEHIRNE